MKFKKFLNEKLSFKERARIVAMISDVYPGFQDHEIDENQGTVTIKMGPGMRKEHGKEVVMSLEDAIQKTKELGYLL